MFKCLFCYLPSEYSLDCRGVQSGPDPPRFFWHGSVVKVYLGKALRWWSEVQSLVSFQIDHLPDWRSSVSYGGNTGSVVQYKAAFYALPPLIEKIWNSGVRNKQESKWKQMGKEWFTFEGRWKKYVIQFLNHRSTVLQQMVDAHCPAYARMVWSICAYFFCPYRAYPSCCLKKSLR